MTINNSERDTLIKYRTEQAYEAVDEVRFLIDNNKLKLAVNRIYYGMFYILCVLALKHQFKTSKHKELIGWFNKTFVKDGIIDRKYGSIIYEAFGSRADCDYGVAVKLQKDTVEKLYEKMKDFIHAIEKLIQQ